MATLGLLLQSCGGSDDAAPVAAGPAAAAPVIGESGLFHRVKNVREIYDVTYGDETVVVAEDAMQYLRSVSDDLSTLTFDAAAEQSLGLKKGAVTVFPLTALRRVVSWRKAGDALMVETEFAALTEAIRDGEIVLESEISWQPIARPVVDNRPGRFDFSLVPAAHAAEGAGGWEISLARKFEEGITVKLKLKPESADRLNFEVSGVATKPFFRKSVTREHSRAKYPTQTINPSSWAGANERLAEEGTDYTVSSPGSNPAPSGSGNVDDGNRDSTRNYDASGSIVVGDPQAFATASGYVSGLTQVLEIRIRDHAIEDYRFHLDDLKVEVKLEGASLDKIVGTANIKVPLEIAIPLRIGLMPVTLKVGAEFSFRPIVHTGSSQICFVATYSGETGFEYSGGSLKNTSDMSNRTVNTCPDQETVAAGTLTVAMGATGKFPTVSLQVFGEFLVPSATFQLDGVVSYEPGIASAMRACQAGSATLSSIIEIKMSLLGASLSRQAKLWETRKEWTCDKQLVVTKFDHTSGETTSTSDL